MAFIITENCTGCTACIRRCPTNAITGERKMLHVIDPELCIDCGACGVVCPDEAIYDHEGVLWRMVWCEVTRRGLEWRYERSEDGGSSWTTTPRPSASTTTGTTCSRARSSSSARTRSPAHIPPRTSAGFEPRKSGVTDSSAGRTEVKLSDTWCPSNRHPHGAPDAGSSGQLIDHGQRVARRQLARVDASADGGGDPHVGWPVDGQALDVDGGGEPGVAPHRGGVEPGPDRPLVGFGVGEAPLAGAQDVRAADACVVGEVPAAVAAGVEEWLQWPADGLDVEERNVMRDKQWFDEALKYAISVPILLRDGKAQIGWKGAVG